MTNSKQCLEAMLLGQSCTSVEKANHLWQFRFGNEDAVLNLNCAWRLIANGAIELGYEDHQQQFGLPAPLDGVTETQRILSSSEVAIVEIREGCGDLSITFRNGVRLDAFNDSSGYEGWECSGRKGSQVIAQGGGNLAVWSPKE
jgi:hypothetical protein